MMDVKGFRIGCCFCDQDIHEPADGMQVIAVWESGGAETEQYWWAHKECFEMKIDPRYREFREEWYEQEGEIDAYM